jgi:hypothetical protein
LKAKKCLKDQREEAEYLSKKQNEKFDVVRLRAKQQQREFQDFLSKRRNEIDNTPGRMATLNNSGMNRSKQHSISHATLSHVKSYESLDPYNYDIEHRIKTND